MRAVRWLTVFIGSFLLFMVQPMVARMLLPRVGGAPAVWNVCMLFFQVTLLAGYTYAHLAPKTLGLRRHSLVHLAVLLTPALVLPLSMYSASEPPAGHDPTLWLLATLAAQVALPFFALSTSAPLVQRWAAERTKDPVSLYAASNLGSLLALVSYPLAIEPALSLVSQSRIWSAGYALFGIFTAVCAYDLWAQPVSTTPAIDTSTHRPASPVEASPRDVLTWLLLAFIPSSLMLGLNTYVSSDIAAIPLLWVAPLAIYLGSFVYVFARPPREASPRLSAAFLGLLLLLFLTTIPNAAAGYTLALFHFPLCAMGCVLFHGELVRLRPEGRHLTAFYLALAAGGALGGVFNSVLAPLLFHRVIEYPITMALSILGLPRPPARVDEHERQAGFVRAMGLDPEKVIPPPAPMPRSSPRPLDALVPLAIGLISWALFSSTNFTCLPIIVRYGIPLTLLVFASVGRRRRLALGLLAIVAASHTDASVLHETRSFFGVIRVKDDGVTRRFMHGTTLHGQQAHAPELRNVPSTYYDPRTPIGRLFSGLRDRLEQANIGIVGLGAGMMLTHASQRQHWTYFEIDQAVVDIANQDFTYISEARAPVSIVVADARRALVDARDARFDLLVLDAFSSDAIPVHLLTREALSLYLHRTTEHGLIAFHITNRYVQLEGPLAALARDANLVAIRGRSSIDLGNDPLLSTWVILARHRDDFGPLSDDPFWTTLSAKPGTATWTDDHASLLTALKNPFSD